MQTYPTLCLGKFLCFLSSDFFKIIFSGIPSEWQTVLDPDQARQKSDLGPNCLHRLSAEDTSRQRVKVGMVWGRVNF